MTAMFGEAWPPMSVPDLAPDDDDDESLHIGHRSGKLTKPFVINSRVLALHMKEVNKCM